MTTINYSVAANSSANVISKNQRHVDEAMTRLATGKRMNTAADDPGSFGSYTALLSEGIANRAAIQSVNTGISYLSTLDAALGSVEKLFLRMKELAVQASNTGMSATDRYGLDAEFGRLGAEWVRLVATTKYNNAAIMGGGTLSIGTGIAAHNTVITIDNYGINANAANGVGIGTGAVSAGTTNSAGGATSGALGFGSTDIAAAGTAPATSHENISTAANAALSSAKISNWLVGWSESRGKVGGYMNALRSVGDSLADAAVAAENGASTIGSTNYATETARLSAHQIISQAATAILAQANAQSATVLSLLK